MSTEPDSRLIEDPEFGSLIDAARDIDVDDAWLDAQLNAILDKVSVPPDPSGGSGSPPSTTSILNTSLKVLLPIAMGAAVYQIALTESPEPPREASQSAQSQTLKVPSPRPAAEPTSNDRGTVSDRTNQEPTPNQEDTTRTDAKEVVKTRLPQGLGRVADTPAPVEEDLVVPTTQPRAVPSTQPAPETSTRSLRDDLVVLKNARSMAERGDTDEAIKALRELMNTAHRAEALRQLADIAYQSKRYTLAAETYETLLRESRSGPDDKRALYRRLGDARARDRRCGKALLAYQQALRLEPSPAEASSIKAAMLRCSD